MRFSKISITKAGVHLVRQTRDANGDVEEIDLTSEEGPLPSFSDALQAFRPYVQILLEGAVEVEIEKMTITTLNLSEDKNRLRGLIVTATVPVENAYNKPLVLNTPLVRQGGEDASPDAFILTDEVMALIKLAEKEATRFAKHERMQLELMPETKSENAEEFKERAAAASNRATRNPGKPARKKNVGVPEIHQPFNPDSTEPPLTSALLRQLLLAVERDVAEAVIDNWTSSERAAAQKWGEARQQELLGTRASKKVPTEPECVIREGAKTLADGWTSATPPKLDDAGAAAIKSAAKKGGEKGTSSFIQ